MRNPWKIVKVGLWTGGAGFALIEAIVSTYKGNTQDATFWMVMASGLLMLARTEPKEA